MLSLALIGLVGGLITGISPCILPVLPVIFFSGARSAGGEPATPEAPGAVAIDTNPKRALSETLRPYRVIAGLVLSFSLVTLVGSALLSLLHIRQDAIRWVALVALVAIGAGADFSPLRAVAGAALFPHPAKTDPHPRQRVRSGPGIGRALRSLRGSGARGDRRGRGHREDRRRHGRPHGCVRGWGRLAVAVSSHWPAGAWQHG